uniref:Putative secreted protein n=1 Tax=Anopheles marajoara TaxID=58244 RepID=A0A2M4CFG1_9DIPT
MYVIIKSTLRLSACLPAGTYALTGTTSVKPSTCLDSLKPHMGPPAFILGPPRGKVIRKHLNQQIRTLTTT